MSPPSRLSLVLLAGLVTVALAEPARADRARGAGARPAAKGSAPRVARREIGSLVLEDVPVIPRAVAERMNQYQNTRGATLFDFHPDGGVLIETRFAETGQVHHVLAPGGARRQLTFYPEPVTEALIDPAAGGAGMYLLMDAGGSELYQVYWLDTATGRHTLLSDGKSQNLDLVVANRGGKAAYVSTRRNGVDFDLYVVEGRDRRRTRRLKELRGRWTPLDWSPDDRRLLVQRYVSINESYLHVLDIATGKLTELNPTGGRVRIAYGDAVFARRGDAVFYASDEGSEFRRLVSHDLRTGRKRVITPELRWDVEDVAISRDGRWLAYAVNEGGRSAVYVAPTARPARAWKVPLPTGVLAGRMTFDARGRRLGLGISTPSSSADVYVAEPARRRLTRWTTSELGGLPPSAFPVPELIEYPTFDGRKIPAWLYRPRGVPPKRRLPVVIHIHGGPESQAQPKFDPTTSYWVGELGVAVLKPNVRGSAGYGKSNVLLDNGLKRMDSVKDIGALLDWVGRQPDLDPARVAVYGGSYGGFMVLAALTTYPERIRCGVDIVGISNMVSFLRNTESYRRDLRRAEYGDERDPRVRAYLEKIAPLHNAHRIRAALFVAQGLNDPRVPASEAAQIVKKVRASGRPVWYFLARDEGHGFRKKRNRDAFTNAVTVFFERHLLR